MDTLKILKRLVSEGYSLKSHHNNTKWKDALEQGELLIQELSKLHQPTVSGAVCNSPCCKGKPKHEVEIPSEFYCEECFKQTEH
jgi:hypothetical protein